MAKTKKTRKTIALAVKVTLVSDDHDRDAKSIADDIVRNLRFEDTIGFELDIADATASVEKIENAK